MHFRCNRLQFTDAAFYRVVPGCLQEPALSLLDFPPAHAHSDHEPAFKAVNRFLRTIRKDGAPYRFRMVLALPS
jgi:hypothetical protein